ncbi:MAG: EamA family transporter RarD [Spirochaetes bacterium]|nr:EamA family transporter RarD [Spirochaetota bacterium]
MLYGIGAYGMWGLFPLYWKRLADVPSVQILMHRVLWAFIFTLALSLALGRRKTIVALLRQPRRLLATVTAGLLVTMNWGIYIWAVNSGNIIETSLGYYLNPLVSVALGGAVLKEKIDKGMLAACGIATIGIVILTVSLGRLPWVALTLAVTFASYGLIKKMVGLDALAGLAMETAPVFPIALAYLLFEQAAGRGAFGAAGVAETVMLVLAGAVTAIPLFLYAEGVKRIPLSKMGFLQYISPTSQLLLGVLVFGETMGGIKAIAFGCIISALAVFAVTRRRAPEA